MSHYTLLLCIALLLLTLAFVTILYVIYTFMEYVLDYMEPQQHMCIFSSLCKAYVILRRGIERLVTIILVILAIAYIITLLLVLSCTRPLNPTKTLGTTVARL